MTKRGGLTQEEGYLYKLCPFSTAYKTRYYDEGFNGNSNYANLPVPDVHITTHSDTNGTMNMYNRSGCPGWVCWDDACWFYVTYGIRHFEA